MENLLVILGVKFLLGVAWLMVRDMGREHVEPSETPDPTEIWEIWEVCDSVLDQAIPEYWGADIL